MSGAIIVNQRRGPPIFRLIQDLHTANWLGRISRLAWLRIAAKRLTAADARPAVGKVPETFMFRDWFALGGYISREEEGSIRTAHATFCETWRVLRPAP